MYYFYLKKIIPSMPYDIQTNLSGTDKNIPRTFQEPEIVKLGYSSS